jgi:hypothetical protein
VGYPKLVKKINTLFASNIVGTSGLGLILDRISKYHSSASAIDCLFVISKTIKTPVED